MMSLPVLDKGSSVRIRGYTRSMMPFNLNASVIQSCLTSCTLGELKLIPYQNSRSYLRQPVDVPGDLYRLNDSYLNSPQECQVLDIGRPCRLRPVLPGGNPAPPGVGAP